MDIDMYYMEIALKEAKTSIKEGELPVGAIITHNNNLISTGHNCVKAKKSNLAHAEIEAISTAGKYLFSHKFECDIYTTLEPCLMCFGAILNFRFRRLIIGARDYKYGFLSTLKNIELNNYNDRIPKISNGVLSKESFNLIKEYTKKHNEGMHLSNRFNGFKK